MPDPITRSTSTCPASLDETLRGLVGTDHPEATAAPRPAEGPPLLDIGSTVAGGVSMVLDLVEVGASLPLLAEASAALGIGSTYVSYFSAIFEGERRGIAYDSDMMRGALAVLEGRYDDPDMRAEMRANLAFGDGARRAERFFYRDPASFAALARCVRASRSEGADAVYRGADHGRAFERRYADDLPFRHGVDDARRQRASDASAFEAASRETRALHEAMEQSRGARPIAG